MAQDNNQAVNEYLDSVCLHNARTLDGNGNLVCESCGRVEDATKEPTAAPLYNVSPMDNVNYTVFHGTLTPEMVQARTETIVWMIERTSVEELASYGETVEYLTHKCGIGEKIAFVARLVKDGQVFYACDRHPGAANCEHTQLVADAIAQRRQERISA